MLHFLLTTIVVVFFAGGVLLRPALLMKVLYNFCCFPEHDGGMFLALHQ